MKKRYILLFVLVITMAISQAQNTFPSSGYTGIGTSSPTSLLHVYRDTATGVPSVFIEDDYTSGYTQMGFRGTQRVFHIGVGNHSAPTPYRNQFFVVDANVGKPRLLIDANGIVTVGSSLFNGGGKLAIYPSSADSSGLQFLRLTSSSTAGSANGKVLTVDADGNVILVTDEGTSGGWSAIGNEDTDPDSNFLGTTDATDLVMRTNNTERLRLLSNGNLHIGSGTDKGKTLQVYGTGYVSDAMGIGTDSINDSNYKLFVAKGIRTRKVKVDVSAWPDYVFSPAYTLPDLDQVEKYIRQNGHLPDVSPATEIEEQGLDLGAGQAVLLKKIEELTLYTIELNKQLQEQAIRLRALEHK